MNLREAHEQAKHILAELPKLKDDGEEFRMLWSCSHYDGPTSGVGLVRGAPHWFERVAEGPVPNTTDGTPQFCRIFAVVPLTTEEFEREERYHLEREACFGSLRYEYDGGARTRVDKPIKSSGAERQAYYEAHPWRDRGFGDKKVTAWWGFRVLDFNAMLWSALDPDEESDEVG